MLECYEAGSYYACIREALAMALVLFRHGVFASQQRRAVQFWTEWLSDLRGSKALLSTLFLIRYIIEAIVTKTTLRGGMASKTTSAKMEFLPN